jgi:hypothetical protein
MTLCFISMGMYAQILCGDFEYEGGEFVIKESALAS